MNRTYFRNILRFLFLVAFQVLVLKRINLGGSTFNYISIFIYPIFLMLLPISIPQVAIVLLGFLLGLSVDFFYDTLGVHAAAAVFTAFIRFTILGVMEPPSGYDESTTPNKSRYGFVWFLGYASALMFVHLFFYFSVQAFSFVYIKEILLRTFFSFAVSMLFVILYQFIFDPIE